MPLGVISRLITITRLVQLTQEKYVKKAFAIMVMSVAFGVSSQASASQWYPVKQITCGTVSELAKNRTEYEMGLLAATLYMRGMIRGAVDGWDPNRTRVQEGILDRWLPAIIRACEGRPDRLLWRIARDLR